MKKNKNRELLNLQSRFGSLYERVEEEVIEKKGPG